MFPVDSLSHKHALLRCSRERHGLPHSRCNCRGCVCKWASIAQETTLCHVMLAPFHKWRNLTLHMPTAKTSARRRLSSGKFLQALRDPHFGGLLWHTSVTRAKDVTDQINSAEVGAFSSWASEVHELS